MSANPRACRRRRIALTEPAAAPLDSQGFVPLSGDVPCAKCPLSPRPCFSPQRFPPSPRKPRSPSACRAGPDSSRSRSRGRRHLQEERPRRLAQDDPAEGPPPGDRFRRHPVRGHDRRNVDRLECERCGHQADLPDGQELWRRRHGGARQRREDRRSQGQDRRRLGAGNRALLHAGLVPQEERPVGEGRHGRQPRARGGRAGVRRRPERRRDDLRALPVDGARQPERRQDHRDDARLPDDHGHVRLHAEVPRREPEGGAGAGEQLLRGAGAHQEGPAEEQRAHGRAHEAAAEQFGKSAAYLRWQDKAANQKFFAGEFQQFSKEAADLLLEVGILKSIPDLSTLADTSYIK